MTTPDRTKPQADEPLHGWLNDGRFVAAPEEAVQLLHAYLVSGDLAMFGSTHFDWARINHVKSVQGNADMFWELSRSRLIRHPNTLVASGGGGVAVYGSTPDLLWNLDTILWKHAGPAYLCGFDVIEQLPIPEDLAVFDGVETLRAVQ